MNLKKIQTELRKYGVFYFLIFIHLLGGLIADFAIIVSSVYAFYYFCLKKEIDLYVVFLLLFTSICMGQNSYIENVSNINVGIYDLFKNILFIGPIALSTNLALALAVPVRILLNLKRNKTYCFISIWYLALFLAVISLFSAFFSGLENKSGLTVGFRIVLTMGVLFLPQLVSSKEKFIKQFDKIFILSAISLGFGLMNAHWLFITFGFLPYLWFRFKSFRLKVIIALSLVNSFFIGAGSTLTVLFIFVCSSIFLLFAKFNIFNKKNSKYFALIFVLIPIVITVYVVSIPFETINYDLTTFSGYVKFKIIGDRKPIWDASYSQIFSQNFFIPPAGSSLDVYLDYINTWKNWEEGSHNIFLEIGRQVSGFCMFLFAFLLPKTLYSGYKNLSNQNELFLMLCFTSIYIMFGLSGQSIVYDGVGFLYWLLIAQFSKINSRDNENITYISS